MSVGKRSWDRPVPFIGCPGCEKEGLHGPLVLFLEFLERDLDLGSVLRNGDTDGAKVDDPSCKKTADTDADDFCDHFVSSKGAEQPSLPHGEPCRSEAGGNCL